MNIQRQEYIREVPKVIECILTFCVIVEVEVIGKNNTLWILGSREWKSCGGWEAYVYAYTVL